MLRRKLIFLLYVIYAMNIHAYDFKVKGMYFSIVSPKDSTVRFASGDRPYGRIVMIPSRVLYDNVEWKVTGIDADAFRKSPDIMDLFIPFDDIGVLSND